MADALVADAIADDEVVGAVDRHPAVAAVPDRRADHGAAAHRVGGEVVVDRVFAEDALLAEVAKFGVADRAAGIAVVHGVPARDGGVGGFDYDVAAEVRHLAAVVAAAGVVEFQRFVERQGGLVDGADFALLGCQTGLALGFAGTARVRPVVGAVRAGYHDVIPGAPAADGLAQCHGLVTSLGIGAELDPGTAQRRAVQVHAPAAADDRRARFLVQAVAPREPNSRGIFGDERLFGGADFESGFGQVGVHVRQVGVAVQAVFGRVVAGLNLEQPDDELRVAVARERQRAGDMQEADGLIALLVVDDSVSGPDLHVGTGAGHLAAHPRLGRRPWPALGGAHECRPRVGAGRGSQQQQQGRQENTTAKHAFPP